MMRCRRIIGYGWGGPVYAGTLAIFLLLRPAAVLGAGAGAAGEPTGCEGCSMRLLVGLPVGLSLGGMAAAGAMLTGMLVDRGEGASEDVPMASAALATMFGASILVGPELGYWMMGLKKRGGYLMILRFISAGIGAAIGAAIAASIYPYEDCSGEKFFFADAMCGLGNVISMGYRGVAAGGAAAVVMLGFTIGEGIDVYKLAKKRKKPSAVPGLPAVEVGFIPTAAAASDGRRGAGGMLIVRGSF